MSRTANQPGRRPTKQRTATNRIRDCRLLIDASQAEIARFLGVSQGAVSTEETVGGALGKDSYYKLSDLFDVDPRILEGRKAMEPDALEAHFKRTWTEEKADMLKAGENNASLA